MTTAPYLRRSSPRGQALTEYLSLVTVLVLGTLVASAGWPFTRLFFEALQAYLDLFFYALNVAVG